MEQKAPAVVPGCQLDGWPPGGARASVSGEGRGGRPGFLRAGDGHAMLGAAAVSALAAAEGGGHPLEHGTASLKSVIFFF